MIGMLCLAFGLIGQWLFGMSVAQAVLSFRDRSMRSFVELAGLGFVIGVGIGAWSLFLFSFCGGPLGFLSSGLLTAIGYLTGGKLLLRCLRQQQIDRAQRSSHSNAERTESAFSRACQFIIVVLFVACVMQTLLTPQKLWDERAIFALKARVLFEDHSIRSPSLYHPDFVQYHPRYPLLLPLAEEQVYALLGYVDDRLSKLVFSMLYCGLVLATAGVLLRHMSSGQAWLGALVMATVPVMMPYEYGFLCGQADAPVACYHGLSLLYLWDALSNQRRGEFRPASFIMAGFVAGSRHLRRTKESRI